MNLKSKAVIFIKAASVWFGIFLILNFCGSFFVSMIFNIIYDYDSKHSINIGLLIFITIAGSLILAVISQVLSHVASRIPDLKLRKDLDNILNEKGICEEYTVLLQENCRGRIKKPILLELAFSSILSGNINQAEKYFNKIDIINILDTAQATGNYYTAAYYYSIAAIFYMYLENNDKVRNIYANGKAYMDVFDSNSFIMSVKALCLMQSGRADEAKDVVKHIDKFRSTDTVNNVLLGFSLAAKAYVLNNSHDYAEAEKAADEAAEFKITAGFSEYLVTLQENIAYSHAPHPKNFSCI